MQQTIHPSSTALQSLTMPADSSLRTVHAVSDEWLEKCDELTSITIDGSAVERISTAYIQLILSMASTLEARGLSLQILCPSPALRNGFLQLGFETFLDERTPSHG